MFCPNCGRFKESTTALLERFIQRRPALADALSNDFSTKIGQEFIEALLLKPGKDGMVATAWGRKSPSGLCRLLLTILEEKIPE